MESNLIKKYAFTIQISKQLQNPIKDSKKNTNFYFDLENKSLSIIKNRKSLISLKNKLIPEIVYSNKEIPKTWKKKSSYHDSLINIMANNENFLSYLGKEGVKTEPKITSDNNDKDNNNNCFPNIFDMNKTTKSKTLKQSNSTACFKRTNYWSKDSKNKFSEKEIKIILDNFKTNFPLYDFNNTSKEKQNLTERTINNQKNDDLVQFKMRLRRKNVFIQSIFNNIVPSTNNISSKSIKNIIEQNNSYNNKTNNKLEIEDPEIKRNLETINNYGPYYSYCPPCKKRNIGFYNNYEKKNCLKLLQYLKKTRGKMLIEKKLNSKI